MIPIPKNTSKAGEYNITDLLWQLRHITILYGPTILIIGYQLIAQGVIDETAGYGPVISIGLDALDKYLKNHK